MKRRAFLGIVAATVLTAGKASAAPPIVVDVYKSPTCGCCGKWVKHLRANSFAVNVTEVEDIDAVRARARVPAALAACHTAFVGGYVVEGHVPAADINTLLRERPKAAGLAVPGMPQGAPGMDATHAPAYDVLLFRADGITRVYRSYPAT